MVLSVIIDQYAKHHFFHPQTRIQVANAPSIFGLIEKRYWVFQQTVRCEKPNSERKA